MTQDQLANLYAHQIKDGELTRTNAIMYLRNRHNLSMIDALEAIDFAIGDVNEFGSLTYQDSWYTL
jgi:hypothetical protein